MSKKSSTVYITYCISINHPEGRLDPETVVEISQAGQRALANEACLLESVIPKAGKYDDIMEDNLSISSLAVKVTRLDITGQPDTINVNKIKTHFQSEYHP